MTVVTMLAPAGWSLTVFKPLSLPLFFILLVAHSTPVLAQSQAQIEGVRRGAACPGCNLFQADLSGLERRGLNLSGARLRQADLSLVVMERTRFNRADLRDVEAYGAVLSSSNFSGANLTNANFVGAYLEGANFSGARLNGVNFSGARLSRATGLSQSQLNRACGDQATVLPGGFTIRPC